MALNRATLGDLGIAGNRLKPKLLRRKNLPQLLNSMLLQVGRYDLSYILPSALKGFDQLRETLQTLECWSEQCGACSVTLPAGKFT